MTSNECAGPPRLRVQSPLAAETDDLIRRVIGCGINVHKALGAGYPEKIYANAMALEFDENRIAFEREKTICVSYRGKPVGHYRVDLVVGGVLVLEIKTVDALASVHHSQVVGYLRASGLRAGLLMNFKVGAIPSGVKRIVL